MKKFISKRLEGFSLIEISIVLLIIGVIAGGMLKGRDLVESAQIRSVVSDFQNVQTVFESYINSYGTIPGDDSSAEGKFKDVSNGDSDGTLSPEDAKKVFSHLYAAGLIDSKDFKKPKTGGKYDIVSENGDIKLRLSNNEKAFLTRKQVLLLIAKLKEVFGENEKIVETDPEISTDSSQKYIVKMKIR